MKKFMTLLTALMLTLALIYFISISCTGDNPTTPVEDYRVGACLPGPPGIPDLAEDTSIYSDEEIMSYAIEYSKMVINFAVFGGDNDNIMNCDQTLHHCSDEFTPPDNSSGFEEIVGWCSAMGWMVCRDYLPTENPDWDCDSVFCDTIPYDSVVCDSVNCDLIICDTTFHDSITCDTISCDTTVYGVDTVITCLVDCDTINYSIITCDSISCDSISCNTVFYDVISCDTITCDTLTGFRYGRNWRTTLGWDGGAPESMNSWFVITYTDMTQLYVFYGLPATDSTDAQLGPIRLPEFITMRTPQCIIE